MSICGGLAAKVLCAPSVCVMVKGTATPGTGVTRIAGENIRLRLK